MVIVFSVNVGKVINIRREVEEYSINVCCKSYFTVVTLSRLKMESPSRTIKSGLFLGL